MNKAKITNPEIETPELAVLRYLNEITASRFRPIKSNLNRIKSLFKSGFTEEEIKEVIQLKTIQWKNNPQMCGYLRPITLFRESNFENYINEVEKIKQNPKLYEAYFAKINGAGDTNDPARALDKINAMFGKQ